MSPKSIRIAPVLNGADKQGNLMNESERGQARLESLTSLRFFAALYILLYHARPQFDILSFLPKEYEFPQGVTFFFILSGFILTYVYRDLSSKTERKAFLIKRLARLWPLHLFWLFAAILALPTSSLFEYKLNAGDYELALVSNFFLLQTWLANTQLGFSFNPPAWSIANELFFYAMFPIALGFFKSKQLLLKMLPVVVPVIAVVLFVGYAQVEHLPKKCYGLSQMSLIFTNPLVRILDFNLGMILAFIYFKTCHYFQKNSLLNSFIEIFLIVYVACTVAVTPFIRTILSNVSEPFAFWFSNSAIVWLPFSLLILFCAYGKGLVSNFLLKPSLIFLGEISFSLYLCHFTFFLFYRARLTEHRSDFDFLIFMVLCVVSSYLGYRFIEKPARAFIARKLASSEPKQSSSHVQPESTCRHSDQTMEPDTCPGK